MHKVIPFLLLATLSFATRAQITSTFDTDTDGWTFSNNGTPVTVNHNASNGNPGGYVATAPYSANATATSQGWFAPAKFLGLKAAQSYGMNLHFDLQQSSAGIASSGQGDVRIVGNAGFDIVFSLPVKPAVAPAWSSYTIKLDETGGWRVGSTGGALATKTDVIRALTNIVELEIRGTYITTANNVVGLDNVILEQSTLGIAPVATSLSTASGKPGDIISINGSGFNTTPTNNSVTSGFHGKVKAVVQNATATRLDVVVPQNAAYGSITITNVATGLSTQTAPFNPVFAGGGRIIPASFKPKFDIPTIEIESISAADVDSDGWIDLVVTNDFSDRVIDIYRNLGTGGTLSAASFDAKVSFTYPGVSSNGTGLWFADLDGDGKLDAITSTSSAGIGRYVTFRNTSTPGNISFEVPEYWQGASDESPISFIGDLDGDGRPDFVSGEGAIPGSMWFNQNISTPGNIEFGSWVAPFSLAVINGFTEANAADLDGDGKPELIVTNGQGQAIDVLVNTSTPGAPSFTPAFQFTTNQYTTTPVLVADMNLDGKNDLLYKTSGETGFHIRLNADTDGILTAADFAADLIFVGDLSGQGGISLADMNGDGKPDIVASDNTDFGVFENVFAGGVFDLNSLVPAYQYEAPGLNTAPTQPIAVDLNGDGRPEILAGVTNAGIPDKLTIYENVNINAPIISLNTISPLAGPVGSTVTITGSNFSSVTTENTVWFGSVKATVLTATATELTVTVPSGARYAAVSVTTNELTSKYHLPFQTTFSSGVTFNNTHFAAPVEFTLAGADYDLDIGDLDNDGKPDVVAEGGTAATTRFLNSHISGSIAATSLTDNGISANIRFPRLQDLDGDSKLDIIGVNTVSKNSSTTGNISFLANVTLSGVDGFGIADFGDVNRDGKTDVFVVEQSLAANVVENQSANLVGNFTTGTFASFLRTFITRPTSRGSLVVADFDNDGHTDMITTNPTLDNISIYENAKRPRANTTSFETSVELTVGDNPQRIYTGDFDRDGKLDALVLHGAGTTTALLILFQNTSTIGTISFNRIDLTNPSATTTATIADVDGDGKPEILTTSETGNRFSIFKNLHTTGALTAASFASPFNTTVTAPRGIATGDLNLDAKPEIILTRAAGLLLVYENLIPSSCVPASERSALVALYNSTDGANWTNNTNWLSADESTWFGVTVTGCTITQIALDNNNLTGPLPAEIEDLPNLISLSLIENKLSGAIPVELGNITTLQILYLADNQLTGTIPPQLGNAASLTHLLLGRNQLTGSIPISLGNLTGLFQLDLSENQLTGSIPPELGTNSSLTNLFLHVNQLTGPIPKELGNLVNLEILDIFTNQLSGTLPVELALCTQLKDLEVAENFFTGTLPIAYQSLVNMEIFQINDNNFTGPVPIEYLAWTNIKDLYLSTNQLDALPTFPPALITNLAVENNKFEFDDLEPNIGAAGYTYNPQANLPGGTATFCEGATLNISFTTPGTANSYQWFKDGVLLPGATSSTFSKTNVASTDAGNYTVEVTNSIVTGLTLHSNNFVVVINTLPSKPIIQSSITPNGGNVSVCSSNTLTLSAPSGFGTYDWSNGETIEQINITSSGTYTVNVTNSNGCTSPPSDAIAVSVIPAPCNNQAPIIAAASESTEIEGTVSLDLLSLITDADGNVDIQSLKIKTQPTSGAKASITASGQLEVDYLGISFSGPDVLTIEVCDLLGDCTQQEIKIEVIGDLSIYNGISPNGDIYNEVWIIQNIESLPDTRENKVSLYNRWGDLVWETDNYDNKDRAFKGLNKNGNEVSSGTYFYKIEFSSGRKTETGYLSLKK